MDHRERSLRHIILIPVISILLIGACSVLFLIDRDMNIDREQDAREQAKLIANTIRNAVDIYGRPFQLAPVVEALAQENNVLNVSVILPYSGEVIVSSEPSWQNTQVHEMGENLLPRSVFDELSANQLSEIGRMQEDGSTYTYARRFDFRLDGEGEILRPVLIVMQLDTLAKMQADKRELQFYFLLSLVAILLLDVFLYTLFSYYIFGPLKDVINVIDRRAEGDKHSKARVYRHDEIGVLALNLNILVETEEIIRSELAERENELQIIFDSVPLAILCKDDKNNILKMNRGAAEMLGTSVEVGEGRNTAEFVSREKAQEFYENNLRVIETGIPELNVISQYKHLDGTSGWVRRHRIPYPSTMGGKRRILVVIEDITQLVESEKRLERVIEASMDGIRDWPDLSKPEQYWSPQFKALLGYEEDEIKASHETFLSLLHPDDFPATRRNLEQHIGTGKPYEQEYRLKCKNGQYKWFLARSIAFEDEISGVKRLCGTVTDIQDRKEAEEQLAMYMAELERSNNDLSQFARVASHDLKAPLRGISQLISWIQEDLESGDQGQVQQNINLIQSRIKRLDSLLTDLLTFSQVGRRQEASREINVETMTREIFEISHPPRDFALEFTGKLPVFNTLAAPFELILRNLISNAIKHHGGESGTITVSGKQAEDEDFYEFAVSDDGQGIDPKFHERVFEMFSSLRPKDEVDGTGMGLSIVEKIVRTYGGEIHLESEPGKGTTIRFLWPKNLDVYSFSARKSEEIV